MDTSKPTISFMAAAAKIFEKKPGQTLLGFREEVNKLIEKDKKDLIPDMEKNLDCHIIM